MLTGTAPADELAERLAAAEIPTWSADELALGPTTSVQLVAELRRSGREDLLPAGLHPTDPPSLHLQAFSVTTSPWGPFRLVTARLSCRSGVRARALTTGAVADLPEAVGALRTRYGFPCRLGEVHVRAGYDGAEVVVTVDGRTTLDLAGVGATPLPADSVQATATVNLARTPNGLRLVQVVAKATTAHVERVRATVRTFDGAAWGDPRLDPYRVASAVLVRDEALVLPAVRFLCRPDVHAFEGTEVVGG